MVVTYGDLMVKIGFSVLVMIGVLVVITGVTGSSVEKSGLLEGIAGVY